MSESFSKVLVKDGRIANITDSIKYAVCKGGMNINPRQYPTSSVGSTSSQVFSIQTPSESTLIDRRIYWKATPIFQITGWVEPQQYLLNYAISESLGPCPLQSMCSNMQATINNTTVSVNMQDILPALLRCNDNRVLSRSNGTTPLNFDVYANYAQSIGSANCIFNGFNSIYDNDLVPRGAYNVQFGNAIGDNGVLTGTPVIFNNSTTEAVQLTVYMQFTVMEPLLFSPFIFGDPQNNCAMYGITNLNMVFNLNQQVNRAFRSAALNSLFQSEISDNPGPAVLLSAISGSELHIEYLTPHASDLLASKNVIPYLSYARYLTQGGVNMTPVTFETVTNNLILAVQGGSFITNTFQLSNIPDRICVMCRKPMQSQIPSDPDYCFVVSKINVNFNNQNG